MAKKRARDTNQLAAQIVGLATGDTKEAPEPDPKAVARGKARAAKLTPADRKRIAQKGAQKRWQRGESELPE